MFERFVAELAALPGVVAVVLGGSRAQGTHRPDSDWDLGVCYRASAQPVDPASIRALGYPGVVSERGAWGPLVDGGAWLEVDGCPVDLLYRDLDAVEHWLREAEGGRFEILHQNGYVVGAPTYLLAGELAIARPLHGAVPSVGGFPDLLRDEAARRWQALSRTALVFADGHARSGETVGCAGMLAHAVLAAAHAALAERGEWALNEKRLVDRAGLGAARQVLASLGATPDALAESCERVRALLGVPGGERITGHAGVG